MLPTPHIQAKDAGEVAQTVLLPGDPLRARHIADAFLEKPVAFNSVRNMLGFTGSYRGKRVSVMGTGMGMPSIGIYSYELIHFYGAKRLVRVGTCGAMQPHLKLKDIVIAMAASTDSNYAAQFGLPGSFAPCASYTLLSRAVELAESRQLMYHVGNILSSDVFYDDAADSWRRWARMGVLAVEMEAAALYMNAARAGVDALAILTVSDSLVTGERATSTERESTFDVMVELALGLA